MEVNISNAVGLFFPNPSLETVYFEAIANSIDANATTIIISVCMSSFTDPDTLRITVTDNGDGFNEKNFARFSKLLEKDEEQHKGVGRLVFLNYFRSVNVRSQFEGYLRSFAFSEDFRGESSLISEESPARKTVLEFVGYRKERVKSYDYLVPAVLKQSVLGRFFPRLYQYKIENRLLSIDFVLVTDDPNPDYDFVNSCAQLTTDDLPQLKEIRFGELGVDLFAEFCLLYSIRKDFNSPAIVTSICADGRTIPVDILSRGALPGEYQAFFLLMSNYFTGKTNTSRDALDLDESTLRSIRRFFRNKVAEIINSELPEIRRKNDEVHEQITTQYPHLQGYFDTNSVGLVDRDRSIDDAQRKFFAAQKEILEAASLSDQQFERSLEVSSRLLTEYVLYRNIIINKLKQISPSNSETDIHKIIVPKRMRLHQDQFINDVFTNNTWLLDDKYMSYSVILSDFEITKIFDELANPAYPSRKDDGRPDIAIIFSSDPATTEKVDVVIIELKKFGINLARKEEVVSQLKQRARRLIEYYPDRIQRVWFYGVTEFDDEFRRSLLEERFIHLFSQGDLYYKDHPIIKDLESKDEIPVGLFVLSYDALLRDAEVRNETFLKILREGLKDASNFNNSSD